MQAPRRLQLRRGNTAAVSTYLGAPGELIVNTDTSTLFVHDGVTVGGIATTVNVATITGQITAANVGMRGYVDFSIQSNIANIAAGYTNTNVRSYLGSFDGNIIPSANVTYSLGNITHQWRDLFVSNTTIYIGGVPVSISASGNLTVGGNTIPTITYVNQQVANVTVDLSSYALNANVTAANVGIKGYVDSQSFYSNSKVATYLAAGPLTISNVTISDNNGTQWSFTDNELQFPSGNGRPYGDGPRISSGGAGFQVYTNPDGDFMVQTYATAGGSRQYTFTPSGNIVLSDGGNVVSEDNIGIYSGNNVAIATSSGYTWQFGADGALTLPESAGGEANIVIPYDRSLTITTTDGETGNISQWLFNQSGFTYLPNNLYILDSQFVFFNDQGNVATVAGQTNQNYKLHVGGYANQVWTFGHNGNLTLPNGTVIRDIGTPGATSGLRLGNHGFTLDFGSDVNDWALMYGARLIQVQPDETFNITFAELANWQFSNTGTMMFPDNTIQTTAYSNTAVSTYLASHIDQTFGANVTVQGNLFVNGNITYISVNNFVVSDNIINLSDLNPADSLDLGLSAHRTVGGILQHTGFVRDASTNQWRLFSNVVAQPGTTVDFTDAIYDDIQVGNITSPTVTALTLANTIQGQQISAANVGMKGYVDNKVKNQDIPGGYINFTASPAAGTDGITFSDGSFQTTAYTGYGNVQVGVFTNLSTYAYNANVTAANVGLKGYVDFANTVMKAYVDGQITAANTNVSGGGSSNYSNVNVAAYLATATITTTGNITAQNLTGNINITGNVIGTSPNVTLVAGSFSSTFDNQGNVRLPNVYVSGNVVSTYFIGNGSQLTGLPSSYSNVQVAAYLNATGYNLYSNANVASYLPLYGGDISARNITVSGNIALTGNILQINSAIFYGNTITGFSALYAGIPGYTPIPQVVAQFTSDFNGYAQINSQNLNTGNQASSDFIATANNGTDSAYFVDLGIAGSGYNPSVAANNNAIGTALSPNDAYLYTAGNTAANGGGNLVIGVQTLNKNIRFFAGGVNANNVVLTIQGNGISTAGNVTGTYFIGSGQFLTGLPTAYSNVNVKAYTETMGFANYSNVNVKAYTETMGFANYSNVNVQAYLSGGVSGQITIANIKLGPSGNIVFADGTVQTTAGGGSYSNVQVATYLPTYTGVVTASNVAVNGNVTAQYLFGNGALLTGIVASSSYSNVQVATYLPTYSGNVANIRLGPSGILTFADGTTLATASAIGGSTYGNANVASYLITNGYVNTNSAYGNGNVASYLISNQYINANSAYSNANVTSYLPTHSGNVGVNNIIGTTPNVTLVSNSYSTTYDIYGNVAFGNAAYPVQIYATGRITTNSNLIVGGMGVSMPNRPAFRVNGVNPGSQSTADVNLKGSAISTVYNQGNYFDATTGKFTAPVAGIYEVLLNARVNGNFSGLGQLVVLKNGINSGGNVVAFWETTSNIGGATHFGVSGTVVLAAGEYLSANILAGNITFDQNDNWSVTYIG